MQTWCTDNCFPLLIQQHINGSNAFNRSWEEFKVGFNDSAGNFWVGNELLHQLTKNGRYKLRFDLQTFSTYQASYSWRWVEHGTFVVSNEASKYLIHIGPYAGHYIDRFHYHNGARFTTYDNDNDGNATTNCAVATGGGFWWKNTCQGCGVNTPYGSIGDFRWHTASNIYRLSMSRMWLTC